VNVSAHESGFGIATHIRVINFSESITGVISWNP
jgi:hypothetical protein